MLSYYKKQENIHAKVMKNLAEWGSDRKIDLRSADEIRAEWAKERQEKSNNK